MVRNVPLNATWLSLCLLVQVVVTLLPQGAPVCVRSLLAWRPGNLWTSQVGESRAAQGCACCGSSLAHVEASEEQCPLDHAAAEESEPVPAPAKEPCRDPRCTLCVRAPDAVPQARIAPERPGESVTWLAAVPAALGSSVNEPFAPFHRGRPPPDILGDRSRSLVGHVVLLV